MKSDVIFNVAFCIICCILGIIDHLNAIEYYINSEFHSNFLQVSVLIFIIIHPIILFFYYIITLLYLSYISDCEFAELTSDKEYYELISLREKMKISYLWLIPLPIYLTVLTYLKFYSLYSLKFLMSSGDVEVFKNVITTTLFHAVIIQSVFQSFPQIIFQVLNNLLLNEDIHHMRGVFNFSTIFSLGFMGMLIILYFRDKSKGRSNINENRLKENDILFI